VPAYRRIADELRMRIRSGELRPGAELPSLRELAGRYGVAIFTARSALQVLHREGRIRTSPHRRAVVVEVPEVPGRLEDTVVMVSPADLTLVGGNHYSQRIYRGIGLAIKEARGSVLLMGHGHFKSNVPEEITRLPVKGVLLLGRFQEKVLRDYSRLELPVVLVDQPRGGSKLHAVAVDNAAIGSEIARRLVDLGHRRVVYMRYLHILTGQPDPDDKERERELRRVLRAAGLPKSALRVFNSYTSTRFQVEELRAVLADEGGYSAVVVPTRERAAELMKIARSLELKVPEDLSVVCVGDAAGGISRFSGPRMDFFEMGRRAVALLDEPKTPPAEERIAVAWNEGETLGPAGGARGT
jgi:DNA-binding LacI/PurR family transcriptional regulator